MLLFPAGTLTNNEEILLILKILLILYYWQKARTTRNCSKTHGFFKKSA